MLTPVPPIAIVLLLVGCSTSPGTSGNDSAKAALTTTSTSAAAHLAGHLAWAETDSSDPHLFRSNADGSAITPLIPDVASEQPHWSPDGRRIASTALDGSSIVGSVMRSDGTHRLVFRRPKGAPNLACTTWSPDGRRLTCEGFDDAHPATDGVYTVRSSDGQDLHRVSQHKDVPCSYSPDGGSILFVRINAADEGASRLMTVRLDGSHERLVTTTPVGLGCDWSPDGGTILAASNGNLLLIDRAGHAKPIPVTGRISGGSFSPDGTHIAFSRATGDHQEDVWTMTTSGSALHRVTTTAGANNDEEQIDWGK
jgi:Tol biopolymer transport system component